ncbi:MAG: hypothetical protein AAFO07_18195 [Bacteroidota bacterium]
MKTNNKNARNRSLILAGIIIPLLIVFLIVLAPQIIGKELGVMIIALLIVFTSLLSYRFLDYS